MKENIVIDFESPLNELDSEVQTYGCRHTNPNICSRNCLEGVCAFVNADNICKKPSKAWKKQYKKLKEKLF